MKRNTGGMWESLARHWSDDSHPPKVEMQTRDYEARDDKGVIYGPKGNVIARVVDREPKMGFRGSKS